MGDRIAEAAFAGAVGAGVGGLLSVWAYFQAQAAVNVRPELADVGFIDALLTNHGVDWVFYHGPIIGAAVTIALIVTAILVAFRW